MEGIGGCCLAAFLVKAGFYYEGKALCIKERLNGKGQMTGME